MDAWHGMAQSGFSKESVGNYINKALAAAETYDLPTDRLLPVNLARQIGERLSENPVAAHSVLQNILANAGQYGPRMINQIAGDMSESALVIAQMDNQPLAAKAIPGMTDENWRENKSKAIRSRDELFNFGDVLRAVGSRLEPMVSSLAARGAHKTQDAIIDAAVNITLSLMDEGLGMELAAAKATRAVCLDKYNFASGYGEPIRTSGGARTRAVVAIPSVYDAYSVDKELKALIADFPIEEVHIQRLDGIGKAANLALAKRHIQESGEWVGLADGSGVILYCDNYVVLGKDGKPFIRTFEQLEQAGRLIYEPSESELNAEIRALRGISHER